MIRLIGFTPDVDPTTEGAIVWCENAIPSLKGMVGAPTAVDVGLPALDNDCIGATVAVRLSGVKRILLGTVTKLVDLFGSGFNDVSKVGGYTAGGASRWRFDQYGDVTLATNGADKIQFSTTGAFADIAEAPKAKIIVVVSGFVLAFDIDHVDAGARADGWACSEYYDFSTWAISEARECAWGFLSETAGGFTAAKRLGADVAVYKKNSLYIGRYVGRPVIWGFSLVAADIGAVSQEAVMDVGAAHIFMGENDFYVFDGSRPKPIGSPIKEWFFKQIIDTNTVRSYFDAKKKLCWWFYSAKGRAPMSNAIVYNLNTDQWGLANIQAQAVLEYTTPDVAFDDYPASATITFDELDIGQFDDVVSDDAAMAIVGTDRKIKSISGAPINSTIITGEFGDDIAFSTMTAVVPRFINRPESSFLTHYTRRYDGEQMSLRSTTPLNQHKYDVLASGRYHSLKLELTGDYELVGFTPKLVADGEI